MTSSTTPPSRLLPRLHDVVRSLWHETWCVTLSYPARAGAASYIPQCDISVSCSKMVKWTCSTPPPVYRWLPRSPVLQLTIVCMIVQCSILFFIAVPAAENHGRGVGMISSWSSLQRNIERYYWHIGILVYVALDVLSSPFFPVSTCCGIFGRSIILLLYCMMYVCLGFHLLQNSIWV